jgi:hypothetical protein
MKSPASSVSIMMKDTALFPIHIISIHALIPFAARFTVLNFCGGNPVIRSGLPVPGKEFSYPPPVNHSHQRISISVTERKKEKKNDKRPRENACPDAVCGCSAEKRIPGSVVAATTSGISSNAVPGDRTGNLRAILPGML